MKLKNMLIILSCLFVAMLCIGSVAAIDNVDDNLTSDSSSMELKMNDESELSVINDDSVLSEPQIIEIGEYGEYHREMSDHTIRNAIQSANSGDTIIIKGGYYDHCHVVIDKKLTIKSDVGTNLSACTSTAVSGSEGIFYLTSAASGTIIEGFNFNNLDGNIFSAGGYSIFIDGASDVIIRNCTFSNENLGDVRRKPERPSRSRAPVSMRSGWQLTSVILIIRISMSHRRRPRPRNGSWSTAGNTALSSAIRWIKAT